MEKFNNFFKTLYSSPSMIWKGGVGLLFLGLGIGMLVLPKFDVGLEGGSKYGFSGLLVLYGCFRLYSCYAEYKSLNNE